MGTCHFFPVLSLSLSLFLPGKLDRNKEGREENWFARIDPYLSSLLLLPLAAVAAPFYNFDGGGGGGHSGPTHEQ